MKKCNFKIDCLLAVFLAFLSIYFSATNCFAENPDPSKWKEMPPLEYKEKLINSKDIQKKDKFTVKAAQIVHEYEYILKSLDKPDYGFPLGTKAAFWENNAIYNIGKFRELNSTNYIDKDFKPFIDEYSYYDDYFNLDELSYLWVAYNKNNFKKRLEYVIQSKKVLKGHRVINYKISTSGYYFLSFCFIVLILIFWGIGKMENNKKFNIIKNRDILIKSLKWSFVFTFLFDLLIGVARFTDKYNPKDLLGTILATYVSFFIFIILLLFAYKILLVIKVRYFNKNSFATLFFKAKSIELREKKLEYKKTIEEKKKEYSEKIEDSK